MRKWTDSEIALFNEGLSNTEIAERTGRKYQAVMRYRIRNKLPGAQTEFAPESEYDDDRARATNEVWRKKYAALSGKYKRAIHEASVTQQLVSEIRDIAPRSYSTAPAIRRVRPTCKSTPQSAVLLFSDTHVGKVVTPEQTLGLGRYDFPTFLARLKYLEESTVSILNNHTPSGVDELVIAMLGDTLDGALGHSVEAGQVNTLFSQFYGASHAIAQFLRNLAPHVPAIRIQTVVGNHTRWQNQKRMPTENRFSNLDTFAYALVEALTKDISNIRWNLNMQPISIFEVKGFTFKAFHGDTLRGGDKALGIPNHSIGREISTTTQLFAKNGRQAPHYYCTGHLHRSIQMPHALGSVIINGGFPGLDNYALAENFNPVDPTQHLFFIHPKYGKTAAYDLSLKFAEVGQAPYIIPESFPVE